MSFEESRDSVGTSGQILSVEPQRQEPRSAGFKDALQFYYKISTRTSSAIPVDTNLMVLGARRPLGGREITSRVLFTNIHNIAKHGLTSDDMHHDHVSSIQQ